MSTRAVMYVRFSSNNQREESIDAQIRAIETYCSHKGYVLVGTYPDEAKSATTDNRPNFQRMMTDAQHGLFDVVVVHKLDRFARDRYDSSFYKRLLKKAGVRLESVLEQFDNSPESIILESVLEGMAEYYSKNLAREARKGMEENARKGIHAGGRPPYGYHVNTETHKLEIEEHAAKAVRLYFESIASGKSLQFVADALNERGYRTQRGNRFTKNSFDGWAHNRKYIGDYTWDVASPKNDDGKRNTHMAKPVEEQIVIEGVVPPIIDVDTFERVNAILQARKKRPGSMKAQVVYLLTGKIACGQCGKDYRGSSYKSKGKQFSYYKCCGNCGNRQLRKEEIELLVIERLSEECFSEEGIRSIVKAVKEMYRAERKQSQKDITPVRKEIADLEAKIDNWLEIAGSGIKGVVDKIKEAERRKEVLEFELRRMETMESSSDLEDAAILAIVNKKKSLLLSDDEEERKRAIQEFIEHVIVSYDQTADQFDLSIKVRLFNGGGELTPLKSLTRVLSLVLSR